MNKKYYFAGFILLIVVTGVFLYWWQAAAPQLNSKSAIELVQLKYPELADYPSDKLPPRSITSEDSQEGWYIAFIQNGSGRPILSARCFKVSVEGAITETGQYTPHGTPEPLSISAKTCQ